MTVSNVAVSSTTSLTASFVLDPAASAGPRSVTVTTAAGTSGAQPFTIDLPPPPGTPTLTSVSPNQGMRGTTVAVTLTGTDFVVGATTVIRQRWRRDGHQRHRRQCDVADRQFRARSGRNCRSPHRDGHNRRRDERTARLYRQSAGPTLTSISPNQGFGAPPWRSTLTGTNFVAGATVVNVSGADATATNVVVVSPTSLTASFRARSSCSPWGPYGHGHDRRRNQRGATLHGQSAAARFRRRSPIPAASSPLLCPPASSRSLIDATGAAGGKGSGPSAIRGAGRSDHGDACPSCRAALLTVRVGGQGPMGADPSTAGGFNGGGASTGDGGGGGGARACVMATSRW